MTMQFAQDFGERLNFEIGGVESVNRHLEEESLAIEC